MVIALRLHVNPLLGEIMKPSDTDPEKPLTGETVMVEFALAGAGLVFTVVGLANIWKSTTRTNIVDVV